MFKKGDRVIVIVDEGAVSMGMRGTILDGLTWNAFSKKDEYPIQFDYPFMGGHDCNNLCLPGFGYFIQPTSLEYEASVTNFYTGDKIKLKWNVLGIPRGTSGTIVGNLSVLTYLVEMNIPVANGHNCGGKCKPGYGATISAMDMEFDNSIVPTTNFKIGDSVKCIDNISVSTGSPRGDLTVGKIYKIIEIFPDGEIVILNDKGKTKSYVPTRFSIIQDNVTLSNDDYDWDLWKRQWADNASKDPWYKDRVV